MPPLGVGLQRGSILLGDAISGGKAVAQQIPISNGPNGDRILSVLPYVKKVLLSTDTTGQGLDGAGRQLYNAGSAFNTPQESISDQNAGIGLAIAFDALFESSPYTYRYNVVDGGGKYECSYYSAATTTTGLLKPDGTKSPGGSFFPSIPTQDQKRRLNSATYPISNKNSITPNQTNIGKIRVDNSIYAGMPIGMLYQPGGLDPGIGNMHWLQIVGTSSPARAASIGNFADDGTNDGLPPVRGDDGNFLIWYLDNRGSILNVHYDQAPQFPSNSNTYFFQDCPGVLTPIPDGILSTYPIHLNTTLFFNNPANEPPNHFSTYWLFKMWYEDNNGNVITNPASFGGIIFPKIIRQGCMYSFFISNALRGGQQAGGFDE